MPQVCFRRAAPREGRPWICQVTAPIDSRMIRVKHPTKSHKNAAPFSDIPGCELFPDRAITPADYASTRSWQNAAPSAALLPHGLQKALAFLCLEYDKDRAPARCAQAITAGCAAQAPLFKSEGGKVAAGPHP